MRLRFLLSLRSLALKRSLSEARLPTLVRARLSGCSPPREGAAASPGPGCRPPCWHGTPLQRLPRERPTSRRGPRNCRVHLVAAPPLLPRSDPLNRPCTPHQLCLTLSRPVVVTRSCVCHLGGSLAYGPAAVLGGA